MTKKPFIKCVTCKFYNADNVKFNCSNGKLTLKKCIRENRAAKGQNCINFKVRRAGTRKRSAYSYW